MQALERYVKFIDHLHRAQEVAMPYSISEISFSVIPSCVPSQYDLSGTFLVLRLDISCQIHEFLMALYNLPNTSALRLPLSFDIHCFQEILSTRLI